VVKRFKGSVDGIHWRDFQEGEEVDLPATSWPGPDLGLVAIEQGWAVEVKPDTATDSSSADRNNAV